MPRGPRIQHVTIATRRASTVRKPKAVHSQNNQASRATRHFEEPPKTSRSSAPTLTRSRAIPWVLANLLAGGIAFYGGQLFFATIQPCLNPAAADLARQKDVSGRYEDTANSFDSEVGVSEVLMGVNRLRKRLARKCTGDVLEVSCGTGRNLGYYDLDKKSGVESLTFVDLSPQMVEVCRRKWDVLTGSKRDRLKPGLTVRFLTGSAVDDMPPAPKKSEYDTVIQTMGLCSTPYPVELLTNMVKYLNVRNPDARILLLEHGRSYQPWLNRVLDNAAEKHAEIHGCWFNRDIGALVEEAAHKTGLEVVDERRHHLGTTWVFELKASAELVERGSLVEEVQSEQSPASSGWRSWFGLK